MTINECKEKLPDVNVKITPYGKTFLKGMVRGRKNDFASIMFSNNGCLVTFEASWAAVARAATNGTAIIY